MKTLKYVIKRLLLAVLILLGVSVIIFGLSRMMPTDYIDDKYSAQIQQGTISQDDVDRIKELYGLSMPEAYLTALAPEGSQVAGVSFRKNAKVLDKEHVDEYINNPDSTDEIKIKTYSDWYKGMKIGISSDQKATGSSFNSINGDKNLRLYLNADNSYEVYEVLMSQIDSSETDGEDDKKDENADIKIVEKLERVEEGMYAVNADGSITVTYGTFKHDDKTDKITNVNTFVSNGKKVNIQITYSEASFWNKAGAIFASYFEWLGNMFKGDLGVSFKYGKPVSQVIVQNMGISFVISFVATILQFAIAIPLGIKAATNQYGVIDYTVTVFAMIGISLPTFFLANLFIRLFAVELGWFEVGGLVSGSLPVDASWFTRFINQAWHLVLPMIVLVILSIGGLMRYTRTNTLEVLNADYIRTARAKGVSEHTVVYKHAFRNTMIPLVTMLAGILPSLFSGAMITETVFSIPGIGKLAYDALVAKDIPFIMGYNMFMAILTVLGTLLSDLMYAVVDPRVKLGG